MTNHRKATSPWAGRLVATYIPARHVVTPTGGIVRGKFPSSKACRMISFEELLERDALYLFEFSPQIKDIHQQPFKFFYPCAGRVRRYTPDFELGLVNGDHLIVEIKPSKVLAKPAIAEKISAVRAAMTQQGRRFMVLTEKEIRLEPRLENLKVLYSLLRFAPSADQRQLLQKLRIQYGQGALLQMKDLIESFGRMTDVLQLLAHGLVATDLMQTISHASFISLSAEEVDHVGINWL